VGERWRRSPSGKEEAGGEENIFHDGKIVANVARPVKAIRPQTRRCLVMGRWIRMVFFLGLLAGLTVAVALRRRRLGPGLNGHRYGPLPTEDWPPVPARPPAVTEQAAGLAAEQAAEQAVEQAWEEPDGRACPASHPIKAKLSSGRFHLPGMAAYQRTIPDRCYATTEAAELDGLQRAKH
jgi:hypothetical protein